MSLCFYLAQVIYHLDNVTMILTSLQYFTSFLVPKCALCFFPYDSYGAFLAVITGISQYVAVVAPIHILGLTYAGL